MKAVIGVYESHEMAISALKELHKAGYPANQLSIIGKAELIDNHVYLKTKNTLERAEVSIGAIAGTTLGILTGVGVFAIPGLGLLYGAGAFLGAISGLWAGVVTGGLGMVLTDKLGIENDAVTNYVKHLDEGRFIVMAQGDDEQITKAHEVLHTQGKFIELTRH